MTETRVCFKCGRDLPLAQFWRAGTKDGAQRYRSCCIQCEQLVRAIRAGKYRRTADEPDRTCTACGQVKPATDFSLNYGCRRSECKGCAAAKARAYYRANRQDADWCDRERARVNARRLRSAYRRVMRAQEERR